MGQGESALVRSGRSWSAGDSVWDRSSRHLGAEYDLGRGLGNGHFGVIRLCTNKHTGEHFACKSIQKSSLLSAEDVDDVRREIEVMNRVDGHPNIVELKAVYEDQDWVHLVMELCEGGELFDYITQNKEFSEQEAAQVCKILMEVLTHCHSRGVIHRDLKPENILLSKKKSLFPVKVADFGLAVNTCHGQKFSGMAGSAYYIAPEVLEGDYGEEIDVWSAGVILYILLSGVPPFWDETEKGIFDAIRNGQLDLSSSPWPSVSADVKDLLKGMLCPDVKQRLTPEQVLNHRWIRRHSGSKDAKTIPDESSCSTDLCKSAFSCSKSSTGSEIITPLIGCASSTEGTKIVAACLPGSTQPLEAKAYEGRLQDSDEPTRCAPAAPTKAAVENQQSAWSSFTTNPTSSAAAELTCNSLLATVVSGLEDRARSSLQHSTPLQIQKDCNFTMMKSSWQEETVKVDSKYCSGKIYVCP